MVVSTVKISEIIPGKLYLGGQEDAQNLQILKRLGVTHILNVTNEVSNHFEKKFTYMKLNLVDGVEGIHHHFLSAFSFIESGDVVFVHCKQGMSRSATIVISYLMRKNGWDLEEALKFVQDKRPIVNPHFLYRVELGLYQEELSTAAK
jgi:dual specificity MAP kinase phosphatase